MVDLLSEHQLDLSLPSTISQALQDLIPATAAYMPPSTFIQSFTTSLWINMSSETVMSYLSPCAKGTLFPIQLSFAIGTERTHSKTASSLSTAFTSAIFTRKSTIGTVTQNRLEVMVKVKKYSALLFIRAGFASKFCDSAG